VLLLTLLFLLLLYIICLVVALIRAIAAGPRSIASSAARAVTVTTPVLIKAVIITVKVIIRVTVVSSARLCHVWMSVLEPRQYCLYKNRTSQHSGLVSRCCVSSTVIYICASTLHFESDALTKRLRAKCVCSCDY
jgi:hypothetical protein